MNKISRKKLDQLALRTALQKASAELPLQLSSTDEWDRTAIVVFAAAFFNETDVAQLADVTGNSLEFVAEIATRMCLPGLWTDKGVDSKKWADLKINYSFALHVGVALGTHRRIYDTTTGTYPEYWENDRNHVNPPEPRVIWPFGPQDIATKATPDELRWLAAEIEAVHIPAVHTASGTRWYNASLVLLKSLTIGCDPKLLAVEGHFSPSLTAAIADRMTKGGLWRDSEVFVDHWFTKRGFNSFSSDVFVATGDYVRTRHEHDDGGYGYAYTPTSDFLHHPNRLYQLIGK